MDSRYFGELSVIGMPGCGKTTIGRELAKLIQRDFIDLDQQFNVQYGMSAAECIETMGEDEFRNKESMVLKRVSGKVKGWDSRYSVSSSGTSSGTSSSSAAAYEAERRSVVKSRIQKL